MRVLVAGDRMTDVTVSVEAIGLSQEDPSCVVYSEVSRTVSPGGAGNAAKLCQMFGANVTTAGNDARLITKTRYIDAHGHQVMRVDDEQRVTAIDLVGAVENARSGASAFGEADIDAVLVSDYGKGSIASSIERVAPWVVVNGKPQNIDLYRDVDVVQLNWAEATRAMLVSTDGKHLRSYHLNCHVVITAGDRGIYWLPACAAEGVQHHVPAVPVSRVRSLVGAGDVVAATITCAGKLDIEVLQLAAQRAAQHIS